MPKLAVLITLGIMLWVLACGAMTIRIDTEVADETEIRHDIEMEASGQMALLMAEQFDPDDIDGECDSNIDTVNERFEVSCKGLSQSELQESEVEGEGFDFNVIKADLGDRWEYRAVMPNIFFGVAEEIKDDQSANGQDNNITINPLADVEDLDAIIKLRFHWTVNVPGEVIESNADTYAKGTASFSAKPDDERETFVVVSQQDKGGGCN